MLHNELTLKRALMTRFNDLFYAETELQFHRGATVHLPCSTTYRNYVQWNYGLHGNQKYVGVYENGLVDESYKRFSVEYPLIIRNATAEDEGYYSCVEDAGKGPESVRYHVKYEGTVLSYILWKSFSDDLVFWFWNPVVMQMFFLVAETIVQHYSHLIMSQFILKLSQCSRWCTYSRWKIIPDWRSGDSKTTLTFCLKAPSDLACYTE